MPLYSQGTVTSVAFAGDGTLLSSTPSAAVTGSGNVSATLIRPLSTADEMFNCSFSASASSNILTIALKQKDGSTDPAANTGQVIAAMRSSTATSAGYNERAVSAALSQTFTAGTSLGLGIQAQDLWLYLIDSDGAGTMKLGASAVLYNETDLQTTVAESFSATATSATPCVFTATAHGMTNNDCVQLTGTPPTGFSTATKYYVVAAATNTFELAATPNGAALASTSTGSSIVIHYCGYKLASAAVYTNVPVRCLGKINHTFATLGNWVTPNSAAVIQKIPARQDISIRLTQSSTSITSSAGNITWTNIDYDTLNMSPGKITVIVPIAGKYTFAGQTYLGTGVSSADQTTVFSAQVNGTNKMYAATDSGSGQSVQNAVMSGTLNLSQNDLVTFQILSQAPTPTFNVNAFAVFASITKIGN